MSRSSLLADVDAVLLELPLELIERLLLDRVEVVRGEVEADLVVGAVRERLARDVLVGVERAVGDVLEQQRVAGRLGLAAGLGVRGDGDAGIVEVRDEGAVDAAVGVGGLDAGRARLGEHAADAEVADVRLDLRGVR